MKSSIQKQNLEILASAITNIDESILEDAYQGMEPKMNQKVVPSPKRSGQNIDKVQKRNQIPLFRTILVAAACITLIMLGARSLLLMGRPTVTMYGTMITKHSTAVNDEGILSMARFTEDENNTESVDHIMLSIPLELQLKQKTTAVVSAGTLYQVTSMGNVKVQDSFDLLSNDNEISAISLNWVIENPDEDTYYEMTLLWSTGKTILVVNYDKNQSLWVIQSKT
ncbi:MAG: hypothetical protein ACI4C1_06730 [Lachnospiraceae bacterium]